MKVVNITVNGKPYVVEVEDLNAATISVIVNGEAYSVEVEREVVAPPAPVRPVEAPRAPSPPAVQREVQRPPVAAAPARVAAGSGTVTAPMPGKILSVRVAVGDKVAYGDEVLVLEAMKMENVVRAQTAGTVKEIKVLAGQSVGYGEALVIIE